MTADRNSELIQWVVCAQPRDYPDVFVARKWLILRGIAAATSEVVFGKTLDEVRDQLPPAPIIEPHGKSRLKADWP